MVCDVPTRTPHPSELLTLVYSSRRQGVSDEQVIEVMLDAGRRNWAMGVTGALWFGDNRFFQVLEGEPEVVQRLFSRISADRRHSDIVLHAENRSTCRQFPHWSLHVLEGDEDTAIAELLRCFAHSPEKLLTGESLPAVGPSTGAAAACSAASGGAATTPTIHDPLPGGLPDVRQRGPRLVSEVDVANVATSQTRFIKEAPHGQHDHR